MTLNLAAHRRIAKTIRSTNPDLEISRFIWTDVAGDVEVRAVADSASGPLRGLAKQEITFGYASDILE